MTEATEENLPGEPGPDAGACAGLSTSGLDCQDALRDLYGYLDGEITEERRARIREQQLSTFTTCGDVSVTC